MKHDMKGFLEFSEKQPVDKPYIYSNPHVCAMAMWIGEEEYCDMELTEASTELNNCEYLAGQEPHTFGALAERIRSFIKGD